MLSVEQQPFSPEINANLRHDFHITFFHPRTHPHIEGLEEGRKIQFFHGKILHRPEAEVEEGGRKALDGVGEVQTQLQMN
jgi:hypothetical protein